MKYVKIDIVDLPAEQVALYETVFALVHCPDHNLSEMREEVLQKICSENPEIREMVEKLRRENQ
jgi:hypothetical protein